MELTDTRPCIICMCRPREVRLQCGHLFACTGCIEGISICAICRKPIYATYNIRHTAGGPGSGSASDLGRACSSGAARGSGSDSQPPGEGIGAAKGVKGSVGPSPSLSGYISSGSESFVHIVQKPCFGCNQPATLLFSCSCLGESLEAASQAKLIVVCVTCAASWPCPHCRRSSSPSDFEELSIRTSSSSSGSSALAPSATGSDVMIDVAMKGLVEAMPSETHLKALEPSPEAQVVKENVNAGVKTLAERCAGENTIIELPKTLEALNRMHLAAEVCRVCLGSRSHGKAAVDCKAVVVTPTVPLVRQHVEVVRQVTSLRAKEVIGNAEVDAWRREQWSEAICDVDVLVTTPQLFLDSLEARFVHLNTFCVLVVDECQHCSGSHPFARIFKEHYSLLRPPGQIRVLGLSQQLVKCKLKATTVERLSVIQRFEDLMDSLKMEDSVVRNASGCPENKWLQKKYAYIERLPAGFEIDRLKTRSSQTLQNLSNSNVNYSFSISFYKASATKY